MRRLSLPHNSSATYASSSGYSPVRQGRQRRLSLAPSAAQNSNGQRTVAAKQRQTHREDIEGNDGNGDGVDGATMLAEVLAQLQFDQRQFNQLKQLVDDLQVSSIICTRAQANSACYQLDGR